MSETDKTFIWKIVRWTLGIFSTIVTAFIVSIGVTAKSVVFDVHTLKQSQEVTCTRIEKIEASQETMRKEWREDQKTILEKLDKLNERVAR
jgi:hypothetical protein